MRVFFSVVVCVLVNSRRMATPQSTTSGTDIATTALQLSANSTVPDISRSSPEPQLSTPYSTSEPSTSSSESQLSTNSTVSELSRSSSEPQFSTTYSASEALGSISEPQLSTTSTVPELFSVDATSSLATVTVPTCGTLDPPTVERVIPDKTSATTFWWTNQTDENCIPTEIMLNCIALAEDNPSGWEWIQNSTVLTVINDTTPSTVVTIERLSEFTNYTCNGTLFSSGDQTVYSEIKFTTEEEVPSMPLNLAVMYKTSTTFSIKWEKPVKNPGTFLNYQVGISSNGPNHFVPKTCPQDTVDEWNATTDEMYAFHDAWPDYIYQITVVATNSAGNSTGAVLNVTTNTAVPEELRQVRMNPDIHLDEEANEITQNVTWKIPCKPNGPIDQFEIDLQGYYVVNSSWEDIRTINVSMTSETEDYSQEITGLMPASNYTLTIYTMREDGIRTTFSVMFITVDNLPSEPFMDSISDRGSNFFTVSWMEPERRAGFIINYKIIIDSLGPLYDQDFSRCIVANDSIEEMLAGDVTTYNYTKGHPYYQYNISVIAFTSRGPGHPSSDWTETKSSIPEMPDNLTFAYLTDNTTGLISWMTPCNINGPIRHFEVFLKGLYTVDNFLSVNITESVTFENSGTVYNHNVSLLESHYYEAMVWVVLTDGTIGNATEENLTTPDGYPGAPKITDPKDIDERSFVISWNPPGARTGRIISYDISITSLGPLYRTHCVIMSNTTSYTTSGDITMFRFTDGHPYYNYSIFVMASTSRGFGISSEEISVQTNQSFPDNVQNLEQITRGATTEEYNAYTYITFEEPCYLNGPLKNYQLNMMGERTGFEKDQLQSTTRNTSFNIPLQAEFIYTYYVQTQNANFHNSTEQETFVAPAGVPLFASAFLNVAVVTDTCSGTVTIKSEHFDRVNGEIRYVALILSNVNVSGGEFMSWNELDWPIPNRSDAAVYYQLTDPWWNPFKDSSEVTIKIGNGTHCEENQNFCNRVLHSNTEYYLIVRIFTTNFFKNSPPIHFRTGDISKLGTILGIIFGLLSFALLGTVAFVMWRKNMLKFPPIFNPRKSSVKSTTNVNTAIPISKFVHYHKNLENNPERLVEQYNLLAEKTKEAVTMQTCSIAELTENRRKNRYTNILPYDNTRVKLLIDEDDEIGSDFINASYITGYSGQSEYIATQGPLPTTCRDFWKMVVQENVSIIVMVTQFVEQNKEKCFKYFPNNHESMPIGDDMEVKCTMELHFGTYCVRILQVKKDTTQVTVTHMQYLDWPDFGVPSGTDTMLQFCHQIRERLKMEGGYVIVHCSAGVGRTGTLIATDILLQNINAGKGIDVFRTVLELRKQRTNMVQTQRQYMYIHTLLKDSLDHTQSFGVNDNSEPLYENTSALKMKTDDGNLITKEEESESKF